MSKSAVQLLKAKQYLQRGETALAGELLKKVVKKDKANFEAWFLLGNILGEQGLPLKAREAFERVIKINPRIAEAHNNIGLSFLQQQQWEKAIPPLKQALKIAPNFDLAMGAIVDALDRSNQLSEAIDYCRRWIFLQPRDGKRHLRAGIISQALNNYPQARGFYQQAVNCGLQDYTLYLNLGVVEQFLKEYKTSISFFEQALSLKKDCAISLYNMAASYCALGDLNKGEQLCLQALDISPDLHRARGMILLNLNYQSPYDPQHVYEQHIALAKPLFYESSPIFNDQSTDQRRLKIAYVSDGFHNNPVATFILPILKNHCHEEFEIFCYADVSTPDEVTKQLIPLADTWRDCSSMDDQAFYNMVADDNIDILVDLDGYINPHFNRFSRQNAPIQVSYLGYPTTTGMRNIQYRFTDALVDPEGESDAFYSEKLLRLNECFFCYSPPIESVEVNSLPALSNEYFTFGSFNKRQKINNEVIALWAKLLNAIPNSRLMMQNVAVSSEAGQQQMMSEFSRYGVNKKQIVFSPYGDMQTYLTAHHQIDMMLDSFPWNGHTNTCHALWMGVPTLALRGNHFSGRFGELIMSKVDCQAYIADNEDDYLAKAIQITSQLPELEQLRKALRERLLLSPLCEGDKLTLSMEQHYQEIWKNRLN